MIRSIVSAAIILVFTGCSHNSALLMVGKKGSIGVDPQTFTVNAQYMDGLALGDVSRENSEWELTVDDNAGVSYDDKTGSIKGVKKIKRKLGPQISGYLVELAEKDSETARKYMEAVKVYWEYRSNKEADNVQPAKTE